VSETSARLDGLRILIVEDELVVAMELEALLRDLGCIVLDAVPTIKRALDALREVRPDLAVLDVNLQGEWVTPVAEVLEAQGTRFVLVTGYGSERLHEEVLRGATRLRKPGRPRSCGGSRGRRCTPPAAGLTHPSSPEPEFAPA
jgi:CheY-like chemotaxis protein